jgi:hypothetical protein
MNDRFLGQIINIKFCVKLERTASDILAMLSKASGGKGVKNVFLSDINGSKRAVRT